MIFFAVAANFAFFSAVTIASVAYCAPKNGKKENEPRASSTPAGSSKVSSPHKNESSPATSQDGPPDVTTSNYTMPSYSGTLKIGPGSNPANVPPSPGQGTAKLPDSLTSPGKKSSGKPPPTVPSDGRSMVVAPGDKRIAKGNGLWVDKDGRAISAYAGPGNAKR